MNPCIHDQTLTIYVHLNIKLYLKRVEIHDHISNGGVFSLVPC
jgi:hypothetical protein